MYLVYMYPIVCPAFVHMHIHISFNSNDLLSLLLLIFLTLFAHCISGTSIMYCIHDLRGIECPIVMYRAIHIHNSFNSNALLQLLLLIFLTLCISGTSMILCMRNAVNECPVVYIYPRISTSVSINPHTYDYSDSSRSPYS